MIHRFCKSALNGLCLLLSLSLLSACVRISSPEEDAEAIALEAVSQEYEVVMLPAPNQYRVLLHIPDGVQVVQRENQQTRAVLNMPMDLQDGKMTDLAPEPGTTYVYRLGIIERGSFQESKAYQVQIPQDLHVQESIELKAQTHWTQYRRIFIDPSAVIFIMGFALKIETSELYSRGTIQTFPSVEPWNMGSAGRHGGRVEILANTAEGFLSLKMQGQEGGTSIVDLAAGPGGNSGSFEIVVKKGSLQISPEIREGPGGASTTSMLFGTERVSKGGVPGKRERSCYTLGAMTTCY